MEWSFNVEAILLIELSFSWFTLPLISVDNVPLLVDLSIFWSSFNVSVFGVDVTCNMDYLSFLIDNKGILVFPHLPPS
jgi:hypothetical protein